MLRIQFMTLAILGMIAQGTRVAGDTVDTLDPSDSIATVRKAAWQEARLAAPEFAPELYFLPDASREKLGAAKLNNNIADSDKIGYVEPFDRQLMPQWPWQNRADGSSVSQVEFLSDGACGLRLRIENIDAKSNIQMRFFDATGATVLGPFEAPRPDENGGWWSPTIWGDSIGVELLAPSGLNPGATQPRIADVATVILGGSCNTTPGTALTCHNDVVCNSSWNNNEGRSVALIYFVSGTGCGRCSGAMLNRGPGDFSPLFMTANHCVSSSGEANSLEVYWNYTTTSCNGTAPATPANQPRNLGSIRLKRDTDTDWTLLGLDDPPTGNPVFLGWDSGSWSNNETATGVHHPRGTFKRISFGDTGGTSNRTFCDANGNNCFNANVRNVDFDNGSTEPGSSGSPIMDESRRMRGTLTGGESTCPNGGTTDKYYGRFDQAYDNLRYYMGNSWIASPVYVDNGYAGDGGNNGDDEKGTFAEPFNDVHEATFAVRNNDELRIEPGNYNERFKVYRPMTLVRRGSSGVVRIGD